MSNVTNYADKRYCKEINGDLSLPMDANSLAQIDFPHLNRVLGRVEITRTEEFVAKRIITFGALTQAGAVRMVSDRPGATELYFPKLERVDGSVSLSQISSVTVFDMNALTTVGEDLSVQYLDGPTNVRLNSVRTVGNNIVVMSAPWVGYRPTFSRLSDPAQVAVGRGRLIVQVGCSVTGNSSPDCVSP